jgi:hypothetical protein
VPLYRFRLEWQALFEYLTNPVGIVEFALSFVFMLPIIQNPARMASVNFGADKLLILLGILVDRIGQVLRCFALLCR